MNLGKKLAQKGKKNYGKTVSDLGKSLTNTSDVHKMRAKGTGVTPPAKRKSKFSDKLRKASGRRS